MKTIRAIFSDSFFLKGIFIISLFILVFISSISYKHTIALRESTELLVHSYKIQINLEQLISYLKDAETGQRGYIISQDTDFLKPYKLGLENIKTPILQLQTLTSQNLQQQNNLDSLNKLINLRFKLLAVSLELISEPNLNKTELRHNLIRGKNVMDSVRSQIDKMISLENIYFEEHEKKYKHEISLTPLSTLFVLFFSILVSVFSFMKINKDLTILKKTNEDLRLATESFKHAEEIGNFSSWQWNLETNNLVYSDNLYSMLGCEPQSFTLSLDKFLEFVHPDDKNIITNGAELARTGSSTKDGAFYRIIRKDKEVRFYKSIGKIVDFGDGKKVLIGISSDITEHHQSNLALEERNRELEQSNKELASFNHIASHDLQEPLRKVETFISRISEKELLNLSETGKEYFAKIKSAVNRMRKLIDDLLLFSRTNKTEKVFEETDLNLLLENAKQELIQDIEEKKAVIHAANLPVLKVISFQIQQLFINLIGNSLKYSRPGITPVIKINCKEVNATEYPVLKANTNVKYYKISISDNGLGFDQENAENIFILFYRLHHNTEYPGTGIGLSICKKIVESHNGFIIAEGKPGVGSTFTVFFPKAV